MFKRVLPHLLVASVLLPSCSDDAQTWTVSFLSDVVRVVADGASEARFLIAVIDNAGDPVPVGTQLNVICIDSNSQPYGQLDGPAQGVGTAQVGNVGVANLQFQCVREVPTQVICVVEYEGEQAITALECVPIPEP